MSLDISAFLQRGAVYTVSFKSTGLYRPSLDTVVAALQYLPNASNVSVKLVGGVFGFFADQFDMTFNYTGDGSDTVAGIIQPSLDALNNLGIGVGFDFVGASGGSVGVPVEGSTQGGGAGSTLPTIDTTTIVLVVIGLGLIIFLASGGPSLIRRATE
jgi:hypothetical protein